MSKIYYEEYPDGSYEKKEYEPRELKDYIQWRNEYKKEHGLPLIHTKGLFNDENVEKREVTHYDIDKVKSIWIGDVVEYYGGQLVPMGNKYGLHCILPSHSDKGGKTDSKISAFVYPDSNKYYCFAEALCLSVTNLVGIMEGMGLDEARSPSSFAKECEILMQIVNGGKEFTQKGIMETSYYTTAELKFIGIDIPRKTIENPYTMTKYAFNINTWFDDPATLHYFVANKAIDKINELRGWENEFFGKDGYYAKYNDEDGPKIWQWLQNAIKDAKNVYQKAEQYLMKEAEKDKPAEFEKDTNEEPEIAG